jgi:methionine sulfoxide reductase heme-binding subunit
LKNRRDLLRIFAAYVLPALPALWLAARLLTGRAGFDPVRYLEQRSGDYALAFLLLSLACTPLRLVSGSSFFARLRRPFGLSAFAYAAAHLLLFIGLDYSWDWGSILNAFRGKVFLYFGLAALVILTVLAVTSLPGVKRSLTVWWGRIHAFTYAAGLLAVIHFALSVKGNILKLEGNYLAPILVFAGLMILLIIRLPIIRSLIAHLRGKIRNRNG